MGLFGNLFGSRQPQPATWDGSGNAPYMVGQPASFPMVGAAPDGFAPVQAPPHTGRDWGQTLASFLTNFSASQGDPAALSRIHLLAEQQRQDREHQQSVNDARGNFLFEQQYRQAHPAARDPLHWRANNGDFMEQGDDGAPRVVYHDPTPRINWIQVRDPTTGALNIIPMGPNGPMNGAAGATPPPQGDDDEWDYGNGGASPSNGSGGFR